MLYAKWEAVTTVFTLNSDNEISGVSGIPADGKITIPATVNGVNVKGIASYAFQWNSELVSVTVADEITSFGVSCFRYCTNLESVQLSDAITVFPDGMFDGCGKLESLRFPSSLVEMRSDALCGTALKEVILPSKVRSIRNYVFKDCADLKSIDLANVTSLGEGVFRNCVSLTEITIPDSVKEIGGNNMFNGCTSLDVIDFPDTPLAVKNTFLDNTAYYNNPDNWENGVLYLNKHLICVNEDFSAVSDYSVKAGTVCIAETAFSMSKNVGNLKTLTLPDGLIMICKSAFTYCDKLSSVNIPDSVRYVGKRAFYGTALYKTGETNYLGNWLLSYKAGTSDTQVTIKEGTVGIADGQLLSNSAKITSVSLPDSLKYIGANNFDNFLSLTSISLPAGLVSIGDNAFRSCKQLQSLDLSKCTNLESIGSYAFSFCVGVTRFYVPASVKVLGEGVFNRIPGVVVDFETEEADIPSGFDENWAFTCESIPVVVNWGVAKS